MPREVRQTSFMETQGVTRALGGAACTALNSNIITHKRFYTSLFEIQCYLPRNPEMASLRVTSRNCAIRIDKNFLLCDCTLSGDRGGTCFCLEIIYPGVAGANKSLRDPGFVSDIS